MKLLQLLLLFVSSAVLVSGLQNGLARTPPMGWLSWQRFRCNTDCVNDPKNCISEKLYMSMADRLVQDGYRDAGYVYVNIDDCWSNHTRDEDGNLNPDAKRFPSGMKALADYMHSRGLKLGIYGDYGTATCAGYPGSLGYEEKDANRFAEWGIDMFKMDGCHADVSTMKQGYPKMREYLNATGRPILFSCSWPDYERAQGYMINYTSVAENCNIWRNYVDIQDSWESVTDIITYQALNRQYWGPVVGPGNFSDPDMLIIGDFSLSVTQAQTQMAMWAIMAAPMLMSNDLRSIKPCYREILLNKEVIKVSQDPLGIMGKQVLQVSRFIQAWMRPLDGAWAVCFLNNGTAQPLPLRVSLRDLGLPVDKQEGFDARNLFTNEYIGFMPPYAKFKDTVNPNGVRLWRFGPAEQLDKKLKFTV